MNGMGWKGISRKMGGWLLLSALFVSGWLLAGAQASWAQGEAAIGGVVTDATGAVIAGATVDVRNAETGAERTLATDPSGHYDAPLLAVGSYEVTANKAGFQTESKNRITLVLGQRAEVDFTLPVGEVQQKIEVTEAPVAVSVTTSDTSGLVGEQQVKDLPLNGRSFDQLLTLNPGVINYTSQRAGGIGTSNSVVGNMFSASGRRPQENLYLLNGVEYTSASEIDSTPGGASGQLLGVDAVREFAIVKDTYGAEYGKRPGAQVNIVTASGTNEIHGSAYEFLRNSALDARNFFDPAQIPNFQRNVFGGALGAPIKKDKAFIFVNYEGFRQNLGLSDVTLEPDAASWTAVGVPASIQALEALWPTANAANSRELLSTSTGATTGVTEVFTSPRQHIREDFGTARFDENFSQKDMLAVSYTADDSTAHSPTANPITVDNLLVREQVASVTETHVFSPNLLNRATFGFSRGSFYFTSGVFDLNSGAPLNLPGWINSAQPIGAVVVGGGTTLNGASQITNGGTNAGSNLTAVRNLFTVTDQVTLIHGVHTFSFGAWLQPVQANDTLLQDQYGQASFTSLATFFQGTVSTYTFAPNPPTPLNWRTFEGAFYVEDAIKLKPSFELRLGFRGESTNGWNEADGRASNYGFTNGVIASTPTVGNSALAVNNAKFLPAPRISFAWSPLRSKKTVIRGGYGLYYALVDNLSYRLDQDPPFNTVEAAKTVTFGTIAPGATYSGTKVVPSGVQPNLNTPTVESYTFTIEQQLFNNTSLSMGYIGSRGYHEILSVDENLPVAGVYPNPTYTYTNGTAPSNTVNVPAGTFYYPSGAALTNPAVANTTQWVSDGISSYNGLQVDLNHRVTHGLQFRGVYTYAKALDDGDSLNTSVATNSPAFVANPSAPLLDYGRASFDIRHSAVINATYDLPFGRAHSAQGTSAWWNELIADWQLSGIETLQSGVPFTPQMSYNSANDGDSRNPIRPSWNPAFTGPVILGGPNEYFNPAAFAVPVPGTYGNVGRNVLQGPGLAELDVALAKSIPITERFHAQFRAEFFNILNRANFNTPNPVAFTSGPTSITGATTNTSTAFPFGIPSPTAGLITSTATSSRQIQCGLKFLW